MIIKLNAIPVKSILSVPMCPKHQDQRMAALE